jgi:hypothetical protein
MTSIQWNAQALAQIFDDRMAKRAVSDFTQKIYNSANSKAGRNSYKIEKYYAKRAHREMQYVSTKNVRSAIREDKHHFLESSI